MLDVFIGEPLAAGTLREAHAFPERPVVRFAVFGVEGLDGVAAFYADGHLGVWGASCRGDVGSFERVAELDRASVYYVRREAIWRAIWRL